MSQLDLGLAAGVSARHISFLETGRSRPSAEMVMRLAGAMELPLRERNVLLTSAGFAPRFRHRPLDHEDLSEARRALQQILDVHAPNPAFVQDREWRIVLWNRPQEIMLRDLVGEGGAPSDLNVLDLVFQPGPMRERCINWEIVAAAVLRRLRRQMAQAGPDDPLRRRWDRVMAAPGAADLSRALRFEDPPPILIPMVVREPDGTTSSWFSTLAVFGATGEITLEELVVESFFPADDATRKLVARLAADTEKSAHRPDPRRAVPKADDRRAPAAGRKRPKPKR